jgi:hypothetical protein
VKENQLHLLEDVAQLFQKALEQEVLETSWECHHSQEVNHGRDERRVCWVVIGHDPG